VCGNLKSEAPPLIHRADNLFAHNEDTTLICEV